MKKYKRFIILYFFIVPLLLFPVALVYDLRDEIKMPLRIYRSLQKKHYDVVFFGDSVLAHYGKCDKGKKPIYKIAEEKSSLSILNVDGRAYSPIIYDNYAQLLSNVKNKPKYVIIPINLRSFSSGWFNNPDFNFPIEREIINCLSNSHCNITKILLYRFGNREEISQAGQEEDGVAHAAVVKNTANHKKVPDDLECRDQSEINEYRDQLKTAFVNNYMYRLSSKHKMFEYMDSLLNRLKAAGIETIVYVTPINIEEGARFAGEEFKAQVQENIQVLNNFLVA